MSKELFRKLKALFIGGRFKRNIMIVFSGNIFSQSIYLLFYPVLTRIYLPSEFGQYAIFITLLSIFSIIVTGQYELTILLPKKEKDFKYLVYSTILLAFVLSILVTGLLLLLAPLLEQYNLITSRPLLCILGISIFINAMYQTGIYLSLRHKAFKAISIVNIINVVFSIFFQYIFSKTALSNVGLIIGYMIGTLVTMVVLFMINRRVFSLEWNVGDLLKNGKRVLSRYKDFPLLNLPATLLNLLANQSPQLLLNIFSQTIVGYFALSQKVLGSPVTLFSTSVSHVFKERASSDYRNKGTCRPIFVQTFKTLFLISIVPFLLIFIFAPKFVPLVFGAEWEPAGVYIQALTLMYFLKFTVSPLTYVVIIAERQRLNLIFQSLLLVLSILSISYGIYKQSPSTSVLLYSVCYTTIYIIYLLISYKLSKNDK